MQEEPSGRAEVHRDPLVRWLALGAASIALFAGVYALLGLWSLAAVEFVALAFTLGILLYVRSGRGRIDRVILVIALLILSIIAANTILLGGLVPSGGFIVWTALVPISALIFLEGRARLALWGVSLVFVAGMTALEPFLVPTNVLSEGMRGPLLSLNTVATAVVLMASLQYFHNRLKLEEALRRQLQDEVLTSRKLESLGTLSGGIAHDFNNILMAATGYVSLARMQPDDPLNVDHRLGEAERALSRAADLTQQLLLFSRGGTPVREITSIEETIRESAGFVVHGTRTQVRFEIPAELPPVEVDIGQISRLIQNLVLNAVQSMPQGGTVTIRCASGLHLGVTPGLVLGRRYVSIAVSDQGEGIPEAIRNRIFDPYFSTKQQGTGLGLATCHAITLRHEGAIRVESEPGKGSTLTVYLPASDKALPQKAEPGTAAARKAGRVLVLDDEAGIRDVMTQMLQSLGFDSETVAEGGEAVEHYRAAFSAGRRFDAVVLDLTIPGGMGGAQALRWLLDIDPEVRAVAASGYTDDPVLAEYRKCGFRGALRKPFGVKELERVLGAALGDADAVGDADGQPG
jgi:signal transduction histidine kinase/ActR/RegA family two-component response regulator